MSPEALGLGGDVDTRSDVFSLGVLLYQLLTGSLPWRAGSSSLAAVLQQRASGEAPSPSAAVSALDEATRRKIAARRSEATGGFAHRLGGDVGGIVLTAIALAPDDRYGSAADLAADVERFLAHEPVTARPPSALYRLGKALRRHRATAAAAALVVAALAFGTVGTSIGMLRARDAEVRARDDSEAITQFLTAIFSASGTDDRETTKAPSQMTAREILDRGAARIDRDLLDQPRIRARVEATIGKVYSGLGLWDQAREHLGAAVTQLEAEEAVEPGLLANTLVDLGSAELFQARRDDASRHLARTLAVIGDGGTRADREVRAHALAHLGRLRRLEGDCAASERLLKQAIDLASSLYGPTSVDAVASITNLGTTYFS
jgi:eukaryotic-like serine/threonine-protein kinase